MHPSAEQILADLGIPPACDSQGEPLGYLEQMRWERATFSAMDPSVAQAVAEAALNEPDEELLSLLAAYAPGALSAWSPHGDDSEAAEPGSEFRPFTPEGLVPGPALRTPIAGMIGGSHIGGFPAWINDAHYGACPECGVAMRCVAKLELGDIDGAAFVFACGACRIVATEFRC